MFLLREQEKKHNILYKTSLKSGIMWRFFFYCCFCYVGKDVHVCVCVCAYLVFSFLFCIIHKFWVFIIWLMGQCEWLAILNFFYVNLQTFYRFISIFFNILLLNFFWFLICKCEIVHWTKERKKKPNERTK